MEKYNKLCNKYFKTDINDKYNVNFYSDNDDQHYIILKYKNINIWGTYKISASYNIKQKYFKSAIDMTIIDRNYIDDKIKYKNINNLDDIYEILNKECIEKKYLGYITIKKNYVIYFILIDKIRSIYNI